MIPYLLYDIKPFLLIFLASMKDLNTYKIYSIFFKGQLLTLLISKPIMF